MNTASTSSQEPTIQESSTLKFYNASMCVQVSHEDDKPTNKLPCDQFHSYETDLLSYHFQRDRPITSRFKPEITLDCLEIHFPKQYTYHSEGRSHNLTNERDTIKAIARISETSFHASENSVWSLTLMNYPGDYFSELEIIKLSSFFGSSQERTGLKDSIKFSLPGGNAMSLSDFICSIIDLRGQAITMGSGIFQLDTSKIESKTDWLQLTWGTFYDEITDSFSNPHSPNIALNTRYNEEQSYTDFLNLMCGFALGIFDFKRMGFDEVVDTLQLLKGDNSYLLFVNRGIMLNLCHDDEMFQSVREHIGISPYLLIPNAVLNNNTFYLEATLSNLNALDFAAQPTATLLAERKRAERALSNTTLNISEVQKLKF